MTHRYELQVHYEDTDMAGIVYHANYLKFIERARSDWVRLMGMDQRAMRDEGLVWVVRRIEADYLLPARFEERLIVETTVAQATGVRLVMDQRVLREATPLFTARVTAALATTAGKPVRLPANIRQSAPPAG